MKETTKNTLKDIARFFAIFGAAYIWVSLGSNGSWLSIPFATAVTYFGGILAAKSKTKVWSWTDGIYWGALGLVASTVFYFVS